MNSENLLLFPTLVKTYSNFFSPKECQYIFNFCKNVPTEKHLLLCGDNDSGGRTYYMKNCDIFQKLEDNVSNIKNLRRRVKKCLNEYCYDFGVDHRKVIINNSWFNIQNQNSILVNHNHSAIFLVGVIFINVDELSSPFVLEHPDPYMKFKNFEFNKGFHRECHGIPPKNGMMIIFPGWINHGSNTIRNMTKDRMAISFNAVFNNFLSDEEIVKNKIKYN